MGGKMQAEGWQVTSNPLGTLYNPFSILQTVRAALRLGDSQAPRLSDPSNNRLVEKSLNPQSSTLNFQLEDTIFPTDNEWRCWWANTTFRTPTKEGTLQLVDGKLLELRDAILSSVHMVITLGTNVCYRLRENGMVVTNCQRQPDRLFEEYRAPVGEVTQALQELVDDVLTVNPDMHLTFTVSPYRYRKYGLHGSQLSKATLLLAVDEVVRSRPASCHYFPAYEIMMDELRDYSYYAPDGLHPSPEAVEIIWERWRERTP